MTNFSVATFLMIASDCTIILYLCIFQVVMLVIGNRTGPDDINSLENSCSKAANWCSREKIRHFEVTAMDRASLYEPFIFLTSKLNPVQNKTAFPQLSTLSKLTQKNNRNDM